VRLRCRRAKSAPRFRLAQHATPSFLALFSRSPKRLRCNCVLKPRARVARSSAFRPPPSLRTLAGRRFPSVGSALVDGVDSGRSRRSLCARLRKASPATGTSRCFRSGRPTSLALGNTAMKHERPPRRDRHDSQAPHSRKRTITPIRTSVHSKSNARVLSLAALAPTTLAMLFPQSATSWRY